MNRYFPVFAALAISLMNSAFVPSLKASESDEKTVITISQPVTVEGTVLPAGRYVLKLLDTFSSRDVISIYNGDETQLITTVLPIHAYRPQPTGEPEFSFYEAREGRPAALHTWFYPGESSGFEFVQSR
jgi:hypothetical protein